MRRSTRELLDVVVKGFSRGSLLDIGSTDGAVAHWVAEHHGEAHYFHLDLHECRNAEHDGVNIHHNHKLPDAQFSMIALDSLAFEPTLASELALSASRRLSVNGMFFSVPPIQVTVEAWFLHLEQAYLDVNIVSDSDEHMVVVACKRPIRYSGSMEVSMIKEMVGDTEFRLHTSTGVFSPRWIDRGTRAMLEELQPMEPDQTLLDLGCGLGIVGIYAASAWGCNVVAVDTNARALRQTVINANENGVGDKIRVVPSDGFSDIDGNQFDVIATNPPYHTDYSIAKNFISGAHRNLKAGGRFWVVVKRPDWYINRIRSVFGACLVVPKDKYFVLYADKRERSETSQSTKKQPTTTRKHMKRMEEAAKRKKSHHRV